jgi:hypothetical protein
VLAGQHSPMNYRMCNSCASSRSRLSAFLVLKFLKNLYADITDQLSRVLGSLDRHRRASRSGSQHLTL